MSSVSDTFGPELPTDDSPTPAGRGRGRAVAVAFGLTVVGLVVGTLLGAIPIVVEVVRTGEVALGGAVLVTSVLLTMGGYALVGYLYLRRYLPDSVGLRVPTRRDVGWVAGATLLALAYVVAAGALLTELGIEAAPNSIGVIGETTPVVFLVLAVVAIVAIGPAEELLFRGAVQGRLREAFGPTGAVLGASALFAAIHAFAVIGTVGATLVTVGLIGGVSLVLGVAYERTRNLAVPMLIHGLYDAVLLVLSYLVLTGAA